MSVELKVGAVVSFDVTTCGETVGRFSAVRDLFKWASAFELEISSVLKADWISSSKLSEVKSILFVLYEDNKVVSKTIPLLGSLSVSRDYNNCDIFIVAFALLGNKLLGVTISATVVWPRNMDDT